MCILNPKNNTILIVMERRLLRSYIKQIIAEVLRVDPTVSRNQGCHGPLGIQKCELGDEDEIAPHLRDNNPETDDEGPVGRKTPPVPVVVDPYTKDWART